MSDQNRSCSTECSTQDNDFVPRASSEKLKTKGGGIRSGCFWYTNCCPPPPLQRPPVRPPHGVVPSVGCASRMSILGRLLLCTVRSYKGSRFGQTLGLIGATPATQGGGHGGVCTPWEHLHGMMPDGTAFLCVWAVHAWRHPLESARLNPQCATVMRLRVTCFLKLLVVGFIKQGRSFGGFVHTLCLTCRTGAGGATVRIEQLPLRPWCTTPLTAS